MSPHAGSPRTPVRRAAFTLAVVLVGVPAGADAPRADGERAPGSPRRDPVRIDLLDPAWADLKPLSIAQPDRDALTNLVNEPRQVGIESPLADGLATSDAAGVWTIEPDGSLCWRCTITAPGAAALRLHLPLLDLPPGGRLLVSGPDAIAPVPLTGRGPLDNASTWTALTIGATAHLEYRGPANAPALIHIDSAAYITDRLSLAASAPSDPPSRLLPCQQDVTCFSPDAVARDSVALILFQSGPGTFVCSGNLLADTIPGSSIGWFLTANHCINTQDVAATLDAIWFYQTPTCNGTPPNPASLPRSLGSTLQANAASSDFALLRLAQDPQNGQGLAGWNAGESSPTVTAIHHPAGSHKRLSLGALTLSAPICNPGLPASHFWYLDYTLGITEGGSSGSPIFDDQGRTVGQLFGSCFFAAPDCDNPQDWNAVYGKFSRSYPFICHLINPGAAGSRIYVKHDAVGVGDGSSWHDAFTRLEDALAAVCGVDTPTDIWIARGTYRPALPGAPRTATFQLPPRVRVYGGFAGTETTFTPDPVANPTILSGDVNADDGPAFTNRADNTFHVVTASLTSTDAVLSGVTIRAGHADGGNSETDKGAGLWCVRGALSVADCTFIDNFASYAGGAVCTIAGAVVFTNCDFTLNRSQYAGAGGHYDTGTPGTRYDSCTFTANHATSNGGALDANNHAVTASGCTFDANTTPGRGGATSSCCNADVLLDACTVRNNVAGYGGGAVSGSGGTISLRYGTYDNNDCGSFGGAILTTDNTRLRIAAAAFTGSDGGFAGGALHVNSGTVTIADTIITGNRAGSGAGVYFNNNAAVSIANSTIVANAATALGAGVAFDSGNANLDNTILWANTDSSGAGQSAQFRRNAGTFSIDTCCVQGWTGSLGGTGNFGANPLFRSLLGPDGLAGTGDEDLRVVRGSSVIDRGQNATIPADELDLDADADTAEPIARAYADAARRIDDPVTPDGPYGAPPLVDVGAHEFTPPSCLADWDANGVINSTDVSDFINDWFEDTLSGALRTDVDHNGVVNSTDVSEFINAWFADQLAGCAG